MQGGAHVKRENLFIRQRVALLTVCMPAMQFGRGYLTPNNPNTVASIVQFGYSPDKLEYEQYGYAEVTRYPLPPRVSSPVTLVSRMARAL